MSRLPLLTLSRLGALLVMVLALVLPPATAGASDAAWRGEFFANQDLSGAPALVSSVADLNYDWGWGSPDPKLPPDHFSARWTRDVDLPGGQFRFSASVDDGLRLYVDGQPVIDQWRVTAPITYTSSISLTAGTHELRVEYFENTERAQVHVWWDQSTIIPVDTGTWLPPSHPGAWQGTYYNDVTLSGTPAFKRDDALLYFDWGTGGPGGGLGGQNFSVRWDRVLDFARGRYKFTVTADDGVRVWLDWVAIIDEWHDSSGQTYSVERDIAAGKHEIVVEYYQRNEAALVKLEWQDTRINWIGNLVTCMRPAKSWIKVYRLAPNNAWEDLRPAGYGPMSQSGELKLFGLPISPLYGWDGQPYKVELWEHGQLIRTEGDVLAGQKALILLPDQTIQTTWACGASLP